MTAATTVAPQTQPDGAWSAEWELGDAFVPAARYTDRAFFEREKQLLWPRVWQPACREDEVRRAGDYVEYRVADESILVVRVDQNTIKAYHNSCRHRGTRLATECGTFSAGQIQCPFHGWRWTLDGTNVFVNKPDEFESSAMDEDALRLLEVPHDTWAGFVWVNPDPQARPLREHLDPMPTYLDPLWIDRMEVIWHKRTVLPANWKAALDGFTEAYHIPGTHPQLPQMGSSIDRLRYFTHENGHSRYWNDPEAPAELPEGMDPEDVDPRELLYRSVAHLADELGGIFTQQEKHIAASLRHREIPEGMSIGQMFGQAVYEYAAGAGIEMPPLTPEQSKEYGVHYMFPNFMVLPTFGNAIIYRSRPNGDDVDSSIWDVWSVKLHPSDQPAPPYETQDLDHRDRESWGQVLSQDFENMLEVQRGLRTSGCRGLTLNTRQEMGILNMHREIDRYVQA